MADQEMTPDPGANNYSLDIVLQDEFEFHQGKFIVKHIVWIQTNLVLYTRPGTSWNFTTWTRFYAKYSLVWLPSNNVNQKWPH